MVKKYPITCNPEYKGMKIKTNIEKLVYGGDGFTHIGSRACFVVNGIPGDKIIAEIKNIKKQYLRIRLVYH